MKGKTKITTWIALIVVVIVAVAGTMYVMTGGALTIKQVTTPGGTTNTGVTTQSCPKDTAPTGTFPIVDTYSTTATAINYQYRINRYDPTTQTWSTGSWSSSASGNSISITTASPNDKIDIELGADNTTLYGQNVYGIVVPCSPTYGQNLYVSTIATNSSISVAVTNANGQPNSATSAQALGVSDEQAVTVELRGQNVKDYGNQWAGGNNIIVCPFNNTVFQSTSSSLGTPTHVPELYSISGGYLTYAWDVPTLKSNALGSKVVFTLDMKTQATEPTVAHNITCKVYDSARYFDSTAGSVAFKTGVQDEGYANVGTASDLQFTIYVS